MSYDPVASDLEGEARHAKRERKLARAGLFSMFSTASPQETRAALINSNHNRAERRKRIHNQRKRKSKFK